MEELLEFYNCVDSILNVDFFKENSKNVSYVILYKRYLKLIFDSFDNASEEVKNRIINDTIFTELIFDQIKDALDKNDLDRVIFLLKKENFRLKLLTTIGLNKPLFEVVTQDKAINILIGYQRDWEKENGVYVRRYIKAKDLNLSEREMNRIITLCVVPEELSFEKNNNISNK